MITGKEQTRKEEKIMKNLLDVAIQIAVLAHHGQVDKANKPYILHPLRVMFSLDTEKEKIVGVLHDVIEDTSITYKCLRNNGFDNEILEAVKSVTRDKNETYDKFIDRVKLNPIGVKVKLADLNDNMDLTRISNPTKKDYERMKKYKNAKEKLLHQ